MEAIKWPEGRKSALFFGVDVDAEIIWHNMSRGEKNGEKFLRSLSNGKYGPKRSVPRMLDMFREYGVKATFFVPGWVAEHYPGLLESILKEGHEIAHHGYTHENFNGMPESQQREILQRSIDVFKKQTGVAGVGFRGPSSEWDAATPKILDDMGFVYSSSMRGDDRPYRTVIDGRVSDFIEIPNTVALDDYAYTAYSILPAEPSGMDRIAGFEHVLGNQIREFEGTYKYGLCCSQMLHPQISGVGGRLLTLEKLVRHVLDKGDVWVTTCEQIARHWRETY